MVDFSALAPIDALWQHLLLVVVSALMGYIVGRATNKGAVTELEAELAHLDDLLDAYPQEPPVAATTPKSREPIFIAPEPIDMVAVPEPAVSGPASRASAALITHDNLKILEGVGSKIEELLNKEGVMTFQQLSETSPERLTDILRAAGKRFQMHDPGSWPRQGELAAQGKWEELKTWQESLHKGRTT